MRSSAAVVLCDYQNIIKRPPTTVTLLKRFLCLGLCGFVLTVLISNFLTFAYISHIFPHWTLQFYFGHY